MCVCSWTDIDTNVACQQLGFRSGNFSFLSWSTNDTDYMLYHKPMCTGTERNMVQCPGAAGIQIGHKICRKPIV